MSFFVNLLTVSGSLDPRSARAGAVETQFLNLRIIVKKCNFCILFLHILRHLDLISFARNACKNKGKKKQEISFNLGPKTDPKKCFFTVFLVSGFEGVSGWSQVSFLVPLGGPRGDPQGLQGHEK